MYIKPIACTLKTYPHKLMYLIFKFRWLIFLMLFALCILGTPYLQQALVPDNELKSWFDADDPSLKAYESFQRDFGNDRIINLAFGDENGILQPAILQKIALLTQSLQEVDGVRKVWSVTNIEDFRRVKQGNTGRICYCSWFEEHPTYQISDSLRQEILASSMISNRFVHENGKLAMLILQLEDVEEIDSRIAAIVGSIDSTATAVLGAGRYHLMGTDIITTGLNQLSEQDFMRFTGLSFGLMFIIILVLYRKLLYLLLVLATVVFSVWATLSIYGLFGLRLNIFTVMTPPLIIVLGIISVMHILNEVEKQAAAGKGMPATEKPAESVLKTLQKVGIPILYASGTTMIGFLSVLVTDMSVLRQFGVFSALGIFFTLIFSILFSMLILPMQQSKAAQPIGGRIGQSLAIFAVHILRRSTFYWLLLFIVLVVSLIGIFRIRVDMYPIGYFPDDHRLSQDHSFFVYQWGAYYPVDMALRADTLSITDTRMIKAILAFEKEAQTHPQIEQTISYVQALERLAHVLYRKDLLTVLENPLLAQTFASSFKRLVRENNYSFISEDRKSARITLIGPMLSIREMETALISIEEMGKKHFHQLGDLQVRGYPALFLQAMNYAFSSMTKSLLLSFVLVSIALALMLRNVRLALIVLLPNMFPVLVLLGSLGLLDINLDLATATITAIIFGVVVDDSIHFLYHFQRERKLGVSKEKAIQSANQHVGKVILLSSLLLVAGFSLMLLAGLKTVYYFGLLSVISVLAALLGDLVLLPLLLKRWS